MYTIIYTFYFKNGKRMKTTYYDTVSESELDFIRSNKDVCIISATKIEE